MTSSLLLLLLLYCCRPGCLLFPLVASIVKMAPTIKIFCTIPWQDGTYLKGSNFVVYWYKEMRKFHTKKIKGKTNLEWIRVGCVNFRYTYGEEKIFCKYLDNGIAKVSCNLSQSIFLNKVCLKVVTYDRRTFYKIEHRIGQVKQYCLSLQVPKPIQKYTPQDLQVAAGHDTISCGTISCAGLRPYWQHFCSSYFSNQPRQNFCKQLLSTFYLNCAPIC